jgi:hypothetical protein
MDARLISLPCCEIERNENWILSVGIFCGNLILKSDYMAIAGVHDDDDVDDDDDDDDDDDGN